MRYDLQYQVLVRKAIAQGGLNIESFVEQAVASGIPRERIQQLVLQDLEDEGPIFGKFFRDLTGSAQSAVAAARRQGEAAARAHGRQLISLSKLNDVVNDADPELLDAIERESGDIPLTWVATLKNTCHLCLPLHGTTRLASEWNDLGLDPQSIHVNAGFRSDCQCNLVDEGHVNQEKELQPLRRVTDRTATGLKGSKRTVRGIGQQDLTASIKARDKAMDSLQGRRQLRLLGKARADEFEDPKDA